MSGTVLIVDDSLTVRMDLMEILSAAGLPAAGSAQAPLLLALPLARRAQSSRRLPEKTRQSRADVRLSRRIGAGTPAREGRADRRKRQHAAKLIEIHLRQRSGFDPPDRAQREQLASEFETQVAGIVSSDSDTSRGFLKMLRRHGFGRGTANGFRLGVGVSLDTMDVARLPESLEEARGERWGIRGSRARMSWAAARHHEQSRLSGVISVRP